MLKLLAAIISLLLVIIVARILLGDRKAAEMRARLFGLVCSVAGHRHARSVRPVDGAYHSKCVRCSIKLVKAERTSRWEPSP
jgi:hypothetical protein